MGKFKLEPLQRTFKDLKKGDYVTIKNSLIGDRCYDELYFNPEMNCYRGGTYKIDTVREHPKFGLVVVIENDISWEFNEAMIESFKFADELSNPSDICLEGIVPDMVNKPPHYNQYRVEVIDIIEDATKDLEGIEAVCIGNVIKYVLRYKFKNGVQDLKKARFYLNKIIGILE